MRATKALERDNEILRERPNVIHDLKASEIGEWEGPGISQARVEKLEGYDL